MTTRRADLDTVRGLALIMMVMGHAVFNAHGEGLLDHDNFWQRFINAFSSVRMPLFTVLSGYVYAFRPASWDSMKVFVKGKLFRLMVPSWIAATLYFGASLITPWEGTGVPWSEIYRIYLPSYKYFWFIYALFGVLVIVAFLDAMKWIDSPSGWLCWFLIFGLAPVIMTRYVGGHPGATWLARYFMWGVGLNRFHHLITRSHFKWLAVIGLVCGIVEQFYLSGLISLSGGIRSIVLNMTGFGATGALVGLSIPIAWMARLGYYSFGVYIYHDFGLHYTTQLLHRVFQVSNPHYVVVMATCMGLALPVMVEKMVASRPLAMRLLFGQKVKAATAASTPYASPGSPPV